MPEHDTHEPSGQGCAALMPEAGQMKPVGQMVWLAAPSWGQWKGGAHNVGAEDTGGHLLPTRHVFCAKENAGQ